MNNETEITIRRGKSYADRLRAYKVEVDGVVVATVRAGQSATVPVTAGRHTLTIRIDWCSSEKLQFDAKSGEHTDFECGSSLTGARILLVIVYIFRPHQWLWLRRAA